MQLADSTQVGRLLVVHLNREHNYSDQDHIKDELSGYVMELAPHEMPNNVKVPFLSLGGEVDVGLRHERCRGKSIFLGPYLSFSDPFKVLFRLIGFFFKVNIRSLFGHLGSFQGLF